MDHIVARKVKAKRVTNEEIASALARLLKLLGQEKKSSVTPSARFPRRFSKTVEDWLHEEDYSFEDSGAD